MFFSNSQDVIPSNAAKYLGISEHDDELTFNQVFLFAPETVQSFVFRVTLSKQTCNSVYMLSKK